MRERRPSKLMSMFWRHAKNIQEQGKMPSKSSSRFLIALNRFSVIFKVAKEVNEKGKTDELYILWLYIVYENVGRCTHIILKNFKINTRTLKVARMYFQVTQLDNDYYNDDQWNINLFIPERLMYVTPWTDLLNEGLEIYCVIANISQGDDFKVFQVTYI